MKNKIEKIVQEYRDEKSIQLFGVQEYKLKLSELTTLEEYLNDIRNPKWKKININNIDTGYWISNIGTVKNSQGADVKIYHNNSGYEMVWLRGISKNKKNNTPRLIHRLVAEAFIPNPENKPEINHINTNQNVNWYKNLEWVTHKENIKHSILLGHNITGVNHANSKFTEEQIHHVCKLLEEDKNTIKQISKITGVSIKTIQNIRLNGGWKHISMNYNIPKNKRNQGPKSSDDSLEIIRLIKLGKSNSEIKDEIRKSGLCSSLSNKSLSDRISYFRNKYQYKSSTTIDQH